MDRGPQTWYERLLKERVLYWWGSPILTAEQNLEGHDAQVKPFAPLRIKLILKLIEYDNELKEVHAKQI